MELLAVLAIIALVVLLLLPYLRQRRVKRRIKEIHERFLRGETIVAIDLETTGLDPRKDRITEVGAIKFRNGELLNEFTTLIDPLISIPIEVQKKTGITPAMVKGKPTFNEVANGLKEFIGDCPLVGYNLIEFDFPFLKEGGLNLPNEKYDVLQMARFLLPRHIRKGKRWIKRRYRLELVARDLGIRVSRSHRALEDAKTTMEVFRKLIT